MKGFRCRIGRRLIEPWFCWKNAAKVAPLSCPSNEVVRRSSDAAPTTDLLPHRYKCVCPAAGFQELSYLQRLRVAAPPCAGETAKSDEPFRAFVPGFAFPALRYRRLCQGVRALFAQPRITI